MAGAVGGGRVVGVPPRPPWWATGLTIVGAVAVFALSPDSPGGRMVSDFAAEWAAWRRWCWPRPWALWPLLVLHFVLQVHDARSTVRAVGRRSDDGEWVIVEVNPLMRPLVRRPALFYAVKGGAGVLAFPMVDWMACYSPGHGLGLAAALCVVMLALTVWNVRADVSLNASQGDRCGSDFTSLG